MSPLRRCKMRVDDLPLRRRFGEIVRYHRDRLEISQEELGFRGELHRNDAGLFERAARLPKLEVLLKLAAALEVRPCELVKGISWRNGYCKRGAFEFRSVKPKPVRRRRPEERTYGPAPGYYEIAGEFFTKSEASL
jgi:transcriptional regulator with XRE-family HTH domain